MTARCGSCGRRLRVPSADGYGPVCRRKHHPPQPRPRGPAPPRGRPTPDQQQLQLDWETDMQPRTHTPDHTTTDGDQTVTTIRVKRACNGCGRWLGDADGRDFDDNGQLTDVRAECDRCTDDVPALTAGVRRLQQPAARRVLTRDEYTAAWRAVEGAAGEPGADPGTVLAAVLAALDIATPAA